MVVIAKTSSMLNAIKECRVGHPLYAHTYTHTLNSPQIYHPLQGRTDLPSGPTLLLWWL